MRGSALLGGGKLDLGQFEKQRRFLPVNSLFRCICETRASAYKLVHSRECVLYDVPRDPILFSRSSSFP